MGTRGLFGFRKNGQDKAVYNHYDSYVEGLGKDFLSFILLNREALDGFFEKIHEINPRTSPSPEVIDYCKEMGWYNGSVSEQSPQDWYCLLYGLQGLKEWQRCIDLKKDVFIENYIHFIKDSLFCEYAYIYDIDTHTLEFYKGFQTEPDEKNRYGVQEDGGYYPCKLCCSVDMTKEINITETVQKMREALRE